MEKHITNYETFTGRTEVADTLSDLPPVHASDISEDQRTEAEKLKDEIIEKTEEESKRVDASQVRTDEKLNARFIKAFKNF